MVAAAGAGPKPIQHKLLTCENIVQAIKFCLTPEASRAAQDIAIKMKMESGITRAVQSFHDNLPGEGLQCDLLPSEPATWIYKGHKGRLKLSKLAAEILSDRLKITRGKLER